MADYSFQVRDLGDTVAAMTHGQFDELSDYLLNSHGMYLSRRPGTGSVEAPAAASLTGGYSVYLENYPPANKIQVIKTIRETSGAGLGEAKQASENLPARIVFDRSHDEAERVRKAFAERGAICSIRTV